VFAYTSIFSRAMDVPEQQHTNNAQLPSELFATASEPGLN